ncbi:MAG: peptidoglycan DD-metalloendopeptidase family protein [Candidatus Paceibacterota bacterium]
MTSFLSRFGVSIALFSLAFSILVPTGAHAATWSDYRNYWRNTSEGTVSTSTLQRGTSRYGINSSMQSAIDALGSTPVQNIPIPVLLGVALTDISPNFGDPRDGGARTHEGEDIMAPKGDYIVSPTNAVVTSTGTGDSAGNYVYTANPGNETFAYMHLDAFARNLTVGTVLKPGDLIGYVGNTGDASGGASHLHFEIRQNRVATDPCPRLTREFTLTERMAAVAVALGNAANPTADAQTLVAGYRGTFLAAKAQGITLPSQIIDALGTAASLPSSGFARDLTVGSRGDDVTALQTILIQKNTGPAAVALVSAGATGYFGNITRAALAEYQAAHAINPPAGYFGPLTRAYFAAHP